MKKLISFAVLFAIASTASAASLSWNITSVLNPETGAKAEGYTAYLFITAQSDNFGAGITTVEDVISFIKGGATVVTDETSGKATALKKGSETIDIAASGVTSAAGGISGVTGYYGNFGAGDSLTAFAVILDSATLETANNYIVTQPKSTSWTSNTGSKSLGFGSQASATWVSVPEPSTAALALAGLALLLKRRKA